VQGKSWLADSAAMPKPNTRKGTLVSRVSPAMKRQCTAPRETGDRRGRLDLHRALERGVRCLRVSPPGGKFNASPPDSGRPYGWLNQTAIR
jgi:hypothetical protein